MGVRAKILILAAVLLIASAVAAMLLSGGNVSFCKSIIRENGDTYLLSEKDYYSSVLKIDGAGTITDRVTLISANPFGLTYRSFHDLSADENGDIYISCTVYGNNSKVFAEVYKLDFTTGLPRLVWRSEENAFSEGFRAQASGGRLFIISSSDGVSEIFEYSGGVLGKFDAKCPDNIEYKNIMFADGSEYACAEEVGIFKDGKPLYPENGTANVNGFHYENGILSFVDIGTQKLLCYDTKTGEFSENDCSYADFRYMQSMSAYPDGRIVCSFESKDGLLGKCFERSGEARVYSQLRGQFPIKIFAGIFLFAAAFSGIIFLLYRIIFVRRKNKTSYRSAASSATALSAGISLLLAGALCPLVYRTVIRLDDYQNGFLDENSSRFFAGYLKANFPLEDGEVPHFTWEDGKRIDDMLAKYNEKLAESGMEQCDFLVFAMSDGVPYCIYRNGHHDPIPAMYTVTLDSAEKIAGSITQNLAVTFADRKTSGIYKLTVRPFSALSGASAVNICVCVRSNSYRAAQSRIFALAFATAAILIVTVLLLVITNIILRFNLRRLTRLKNAFGKYKKNRDPDEFLISGNDEVSATGGAISLMTESIRVHQRDLSAGNRKYRRLMSEGVLRLLGKDEVSKINFGENVTENVLLVRFMVCGDNSVLEGIGAFADRLGGGVLSFGSRKADVYFSRQESFPEVLKTLSELDFPYEILASCGELCAGSAGDSQNAWLAAMSDELAEFDRICFKSAGAQRVLISEKCGKWLHGAEFDAVEPGGSEYFEIRAGELYEDASPKNDDNSDNGSDTADSGGNIFAV